MKTRFDLGSRPADAKMVVCYFLTATFLVPIVASLSQKEYPFLKTQINDEKHALAFNKLLSSIVKVNQKRLDAIKKLTKLQATDLNPMLGDNLRSDTARRDSDESDSDRNDNVIYLVIPDTPPDTSHNRTEPNVATTTAQNTPLVGQRIKKPEPQQKILALPELRPEQIRAHDLKGSNGTIKQINMTKDGLDALRQSIARSCRSKEVKKCKSACRAAVKSACEVYECRKKLKKKLKKECKRECKDEFRSSW